jgi:hypothetical protein
MVLFHVEINARNLDDFGNAMIEAPSTDGIIISIDNGELYRIGAVIMGMIDHDTGGLHVHGPGLVNSPLENVWRIVSHSV